MSEKVVLDREDVRRTLVRIAHEIVEQTGGERIAIVGIHSPRRPARRPPARPVAELVGEPVPLGDVDISFYRDDVGIRGPDYQPVVHSSHIDFPSTAPRWSWSTTCSTPAAPCAPPSTRCSTTGARARAARGAGRPRPPRAADPPRLRRQEPADRPRRAGQRPLEELDGVDAVRSPSPSEEHA